MNLHPKLATCLEVAEWRGGHPALEEALFAEADCVTATGSDEALTAIRSRLPPRVRFIGYGHRVSFGYVAGDVLTPLHAKKIIARAADDVVAWDQLGCLSPHVFYVQSGGGVAGAVCRATGRGVGTARSDDAARELAPEAAATIASRRAIYEVRAAHIPTRICGRARDSTAWTVVCEADGRFPSRAVYTGSST
jgi:hypothetical protein